MNRQEFLYKINSSPNMEIEIVHEFTPKYEKDFFQRLEDLGRKNIIQNPDKIIKFAKNFSRICFSRTEIKSKDTIKIDIQLSTAFYNEELEMSIAYIGEVKNSCGVIERFYMSEDGRIGRAKETKVSRWNFDNNGWISYNVDDFIDYLLTKEYDYHIPISERTYQKLHEAGWYKGRNVDISNIIKECEEHNVTLTQPQKNFLSEFAGIGTSNIYGKEGFFVDDGNYKFGWKSYCLWDNPNNDWDYCPFDKNSKEYRTITVVIGLYYDCSCDIELSPEGLIGGRTIMEGWELILSEK